MEADDLTAQGMEQGVADSRNILMFLSEDLMGRPFCIKEQRWGVKYGCKFVGVTEMDERHGQADFGVEIAKTPEDLKFLFSEVEFEPYQRREHLVQAMLDQILKRVTLSSLEPQPEPEQSPTTSEAADTAVSAEDDYCFHVTTQMPRVREDAAGHSPAAATSWHACSAQTSPRATPPRRPLQTRGSLASPHRRTVQFGPKSTFRVWLLRWTRRLWLSPLVTRSRNGWSR